MLDLLYQWDAGTLLYIQNHIRMTWLTPIEKFLTSLGNAGLVWIILCVLLLLIHSTRRTGIAASISLAVNFLLCNVLIKNMAARIRPYEVIPGLQLLVDPATDFSFPSAHSSSSFAVAVVIFLRMDRKYGIPALILAALIALSRLYVGIHYPTDVIAGIGIGIAVALLTDWMEQKWCAYFNKLHKIP